MSYFWRIKLLKNNPIPFESAGDYKVPSKTTDSWTITFLLTIEEKNYFMLFFHTIIMDFNAYLMLLQPFLVGYFIVIFSARVDDPLRLLLEVFALHGTTCKSWFWSPEEKKSLLELNQNSKASAANSVNKSHLFEIWRSLKSLITHHALFFESPKS